MGYFSANTFGANHFASNYFSGAGVVVDTGRLEIVGVSGAEKPFPGVPALVVTMPGVMTTTIALAAMSLLWRKLTGASASYLPFAGESDESTMSGTPTTVVPAPSGTDDPVPFPGARLTVLTIDGVGSIVVVLPGASQLPTEL